MTEKNVFNLTFISNSNMPLRLSIPRANKTLTLQNVTNFMTNIINTTAVLTAAGRPTQIKGAELVTTQIERVA